MTEKSLDDFFAKKGKKGKKNKAKFTTTDEIAKNLSLTSVEEPRKTQKKQEKDKRNDDKSGVLENVEGTANEKPAEEWKEVAHEETDYSDLKIQALQISEEPLKVDSEGDEEEVDEFGEIIRSKSQVAAGPWNKSLDPESAGQPSTTEPVVRSEPKVDAPNVKGGVYVPPGRRSGATVDKPKPKGRGKSRRAPEIDCEQEFPTLAASSDILKHSDKREDRTFETVTKGIPKSDGSAARGPNLQLDNRFAALERH